MKEEILSGIMGIVILLGGFYAVFFINRYNLYDLFDLIFTGIVLIVAWFAISFCSYMLITIIKGDPY